MKKKLLIQSDYYVQVKPQKLPYLEEKQNSVDRFNFYPFHGKQYLSSGEKIWSLELLRLTNLEVYKLLKKAIDYVKDTEEYVSYMLENSFSTEKYVGRMPPGTLRFYSQDLICFFNGRDWTKITP